MAKIPINIITGFLGSGKTTLLWQILQTQKQHSIGVIINEIGEIGLDGVIVKQRITYTKEQMMVLSGGCLCCNRRVDLIDKLKNLLNEYQSKGNALKRVIIETTGLANPAPILFSILTDTFLSHHFTTQGIITCIDSINGLTHLDQHIEATHQIIASDIVLITKSDLLHSSDSLNILQEKIKTLNPSAKIFDKARLSNIYHLFKVKQTQYNPNHLLDSQTKAFHNSDIQTLCIEFKKPLDWSAFGIWLSMLLYRYGDKILRTKGILDTNEDVLVAINGVQHIIHPPTHLKRDKANNQPSQLVFITKNLAVSRIYDSLYAFASLLDTKISIKRVG